MRVLFGIILGALLTVGAASLLRFTRTGGPTTASAQTNPRPLVNRDVVGTKWQRLTPRAEWVKLAGSTRTPE